jgi:biopolymer transport protein ExbD
VTARIAADRDVAYARVITVMDLLRAEGVTQVSFLTAPAP